MTDSEKIDDITKRLKRVETSTHIQTFLAIIAFLGIVSIGSLMNKK